MPALQPLYMGHTLTEACVQGDLPAAVMLWFQGHKQYDIVNTPDSSGFPPLHWAAYHGNLPIIRFLVSKGAKVNIKAGTEESTALHWAACGGHLAVINFLIQQGADPLIGDVKGYSALMHAVQYGFPLVVHLVISRIPDFPINHVDAFGHTLVHWAAYKNHLNTLRYLVDQYHIPVNVTDDQQRTALHWAAREGATACCRFLVARGANVQARDKQDHTALLWAVELHRRETARFLEQCARKSSDAELGMISEFDTAAISTIALATTDRLQGLVLGGSIATVFVYYHILSHYVPVFFSMILPFIILSPPATALVLSLPFFKNLREKNPGTQVLHARSLLYVGLALSVPLCLIHCFATSTAFSTTVINFPTLSVVCGAAWLMAAVFGFATSRTSAGCIDPVAVVLQPGSEEFRAIEEMTVDPPRCLQMTQYIVDVAEMPSRRAYRCPSTRQCVVRYDHFSRFLDQPIGVRNHRLYYLAVLCLVVGSTLMTYFAWGHDFSIFKKPIHFTWPKTMCHTIEAFFVWFIPGLLTTIWRLATTQPTSNQHAALWLYFYGAVYTLPAVGDFLIQTLMISIDATYFEVMHKHGVMGRRKGTRPSGLRNLPANWFTFFRGAP
eukprot:NODE_405_length_2288_cov_41.603841_g374_i0.p1 GENE.NODE_405_length_2288_cov_41.603841_g374_i0~~NODE_405_length_2288_cov_41.603841_g374_i0.p1  ORF type:complete len:612 (-),score=92.03 NODE_405_length_2288_cov_41.603841_g374_i0:322-2157(-)